MRYNFLVAGIRIGIDLPFPLEISPESQAFFCGSEYVDNDILFVFSAVEEMKLPSDKCTSILEYCFYPDDNGCTIYSCRLPKVDPFFSIRWNRSDNREISCFYVSGNEWRLCYSRNIFTHVNLEMLLLMHSRLLLHSSFIRWRNQGILFTAPSGTGKSTQAKLWEDFENAEILNGDRAALVKQGDCWCAWGLPYAGTSGIYRNESAQVSAIIVLRQGNENRIKQIGYRDSIRYIFPELTNHQWDSAYVERLWNLMSDMLTDIPIYYLECLPNRDAVQLVKNTLLEGGIICESDSC